MSSIDDLMADLKDVAELEKFAKRQYKTILDLTKKNQEMALKIAHLEKLLENSNISVVGDVSKISSPNEPHEKIICEIQLSKLNEISMMRELTAEESKKVETYSKILATFRANKKPEVKPEERQSTADLLRLVNNNES